MKNGIFFFVISSLVPARDIQVKRKQVSGYCVEINHKIKNNSGNPEAM